MQFVRRSPSDWCRRFDLALGRDLSDIVYQFDAPSACRTDAGKTTSVSGFGRDQAVDEDPFSGSVDMTGVE